MRFLRAWEVIDWHIRDIVDGIVEKPRPTSNETMPSVGEQVIEGQLQGAIQANADAFRRVT